MSPSPSPSMAAEALPWFWVIETLADCKQAKASDLRGLGPLAALMARVPFLATDATAATAGARERVALRCLDEFVTSAGGCGGTLGTDRPSTSGSACEIDVGRSSEEVLFDLVRKRSKDRANVVTDGLRQFILQKKATLPKSSLDLLKESILEGRFQSLSSLKEQSGLCQQQCNNDAEIQLKHKSIIHTPASEFAMQEKTTASAHHLPKQNVPGSEIGCLQKDVIMGGNDVQLLKESSMPEQPGKDNSVCNDGQIQSIEQIAAAPGPYSDNMVLQVDSSGLGEHLIDPNMSDDKTGRCNLYQDVVNTTIHDAELLRDTSLPQPACSDETNFPVATSNGSGKNISSTLCEKEHIHDQPTVVPETEISSDGTSDGPSDIDPESDVVGNEKQKLFGSPNYVNIDSIPGDLSQQDLCMKCGKGGQMLHCSSSGCMTSVHESCLGPPVNFEKTGLFYCPLCSYKRAAIAFHKAKKNFFRAKNALSCFIGKDVVQGHQKKHLPAKYRREKSQATVVGAVSQKLDVHSNQCQHDRADENSLKEEQQQQQQQQTEIAGICNEGKLPCGRTENEPCPAGCDVPQNLAFLINRQHTGVIEHQQQSDCHAAADCGNLPIEERNICNTILFGDVSGAKPKGSIHMFDDHVEIQQQKNGDQVETVLNHDTDQKAPSPRTGQRHRKRVREDAAAVSETHHFQGAAENQNRDEYSLRNKREHLRRLQHYSNPIAQLGRRRKLPWTVEEEAALKEAVTKFSAENYGKLPWTKILEFGQHIFHRTRQPGDLKDKWRNIKNREGLMS